MFKIYMADAGKLSRNKLSDKLNYLIPWYVLNYL